MEAILYFLAYVVWAWGEPLVAATSYRDVAVILGGNVAGAETYTGKNFYRLSVISSCVHVGKFLKGRV
jgi:hypothetical protein